MTSWQSNGVPKPRVHKVKRNFFEHDSYQERVPIHKALTPEELTDLVRETLTLAKTPEHHVNDGSFGFFFLQKNIIN